jgi:hypothetical protein
VCFISFTATPEDIAFAAKLYCDIKRFFDLRGGKAEDIGGV